jgi:catechol 2,3-dioxygenase-like lactoylglutathione lyase family enzyme
MSDIIDHVSLKVTDFSRAKDFYVAALGTLGIKLMAEFEHAGIRHAGFGIERPTFWIGSGRDFRSDAHVAFVARSRAEVAAFYSAAIAAGGRDNGAPGLRAHYHPNYFGAFVFDPDGHNIEAVCHVSE